LVLLAVIAGVLVIGILASLVPARRAAHVHPMDVLRLE
jgi:ABC-type lipoprotein release transport system permease subunit